jgi:formylglycine-generating enzyme required for sulfatase activity
LYKGNDRMRVTAGERGWYVIRGGSFESRPDGDKPITATVRNWVAPDTRDVHLGFRLVRAEP